MKKTMASLPDELWAIILVLLPLKTIIASKLVCKLWKSIIESSYFEELFLSQHQKLHSTSWSLIYKNDRQEVVAHYGCENWGLQRSLTSYIKSFITTNFMNHPEVYKQARVVAYTDVGFILIRVVSLFENVSYYVVHPVSHECLEIDPPLFEPTGHFTPLGIATRIDKNGVLSGFKVVLSYYVRSWEASESLTLVIYSSETGLWGREIVHFPFGFLRQDHHRSISSNENLHWFARKRNHDEVVISIDFYSAAGTGSVQCLVTPFPDLGKVPKHARTCTSSQGFVMYMNITKDDENVGEKFSIWRLKSGEWQLVSEIIREKAFNHIPFAMNPVDDKLVYFASRYGKRLLSMNLLNGNFVYHKNLERSNDGRTLSTVEGEDIRWICKVDPGFSSFVLPQWLHRIPNKVREV